VSQICRTEASGDLLTAEELRGNAKDRVNELPLADWIAFRDPADLTLPVCVHRPVALDGSARTLCRTEAEARRYPLLDESMVLLNGLITNDKFCLTRISRRKLRYARCRRVSSCAVDDGCEYLRDEGHHRGANEAAVETPASISTDHGCGTAVDQPYQSLLGLNVPSDLGSAASLQFARRITFSGMTDSAA
jgi:hypothetical protein